MHGFRHVRLVKSRREGKELYYLTQVATLGKWTKKSMRFW